jgi:hypothetical protein
MGVHGSSGDLLRHDGNVTAVASPSTGATIATTTTGTAPGIVSRVIAEIPLFDAGVSAGPPIAARATRPAAARNPARRINVDAHNEIRDLNGHVAAVASVLTIFAARALQPVPAGSPISWMIISVPVVGSVGTL